MSLFIKKAKYKNGKVYCSIVDGYRINGKVKQTVVRNYGYYSDLKSKHNNVNSFLNNELDILKKEFEHEDILGDIVISIKRVEEQAKEYGHSFERELSYMVVHGFYHLMGYDHIKEEDKLVMRSKEEKVLTKLGITREELDEK